MSNDIHIDIPVMMSNLVSDFAFRIALYEAEWL